MNNSTSEPSHDFRSIWETTLEVGSLGLITLVGIPGNVLVFVSVLCVRKLRTVTNSFIVSLCVADLLVCSLMIPFLVPSRVYRRWVLPDVMCVLQGFVNFLTIYASLFFLAAVAVNRLIIIRWPTQYSNIFEPRKACFIHASLWILSGACALPPMLGWGRYRYDSIRDNCLFDRQAAPSFSIFFAATGITIPFVITSVSYVMIWVTFMKVRKSLRHRNSGISRDELRLTKNLFVVWVVFFICWAPMNVMLIIDPLGNIARPYYMAAIWLLLFNSCVNPIIYGLANNNFREGYTVMLSSCARRHNVTTVRPSHTNLNSRSTEIECTSRNHNNISRPDQWLEPRDRMVTS